MTTTPISQATTEAELSLERSSSRGFTLLELVVVAGLIGLMASLVVPQMFSGGRQREVRSSVRQFVSAVRAASGRAIGQRKRARLVVFPDEGTFSIQGSGREFELPEFAQFGDVEGGREGEDGEIIYDFHPTGSSSGGRVVIEFEMGGSDQAYELSISPLMSTVAIKEAF